MDAGCSHWRPAGENDIPIPGVLFLSKFGAIVNLKSNPANNVHIYRYLLSIMLVSTLDLLQVRRMNMQCMMKMERKWRPATRRKDQVTDECYLYVVM